MKPIIRWIPGLVLTLSACSTGNDSTTPTAATRVDAAPAAAVTTVPFRCDANAGGPGYSYLSATGELTAAGVPINVTVFPTFTPTPISSFRAAPVVAPGYSLPASFPRYQVWNVTGHAGGVGTVGDLYYLLIPRVLPGAGGVVPGEIHLLFGEGAGGSWQAIGICLIGR